MAKRRMVNPSIWTHEKFVLLPDKAKLLYLATITLADDAGLLSASPVRLKAQVFPLDNDVSMDDLKAMVEGIHAERLAFAYLDNGRTYLCHPSFISPTTQTISPAHRQKEYTNPLPDPKEVEAHTPDATYRAQVWNIVKHVKPRKSRAKEQEPAKPYVPSANAIKAYEAWDKHHPLKSEHRESHLKTFDAMHTVDKLEWDVIFSICRHCVEVWVPAGYIGSPGALREKKKVEGVLSEDMQWEKVQRQIGTKKPDPLDELVRQVG